MSEFDLRKPAILADDESEVILHPGREGGGQGSGRLSIPSEMGVLPVKDSVIFPITVVPLRVGREKSKALLNQVLPKERIVLALCQKDSKVDDPDTGDLYQVGTACMVLKLLDTGDGNQSVILHGLSRARVVQWSKTDPYFRAKVDILEDRALEGKELDALVHNARELARRTIQLTPSIPEEASAILEQITEPGPLADFLASNLQLDTGARQQLLEELDVGERLRKIGEALQKHLEILQLSNKIQDQVRANIDKSQREYFLQEQLKAIQKELGQVDEQAADLEELRSKIESAGMPDNVWSEAKRDLGRLERLGAASPEYGVIRTHLELLSELPWRKSTEDRMDVNNASRVLDEDHYNLEKVKKRILEYLAVRKLAPESRGPILCFVGPPGVGKTSLGQSIARALGRKFIRMSLGGMRDEAELRGHRRTYIGAMPGRIIQEIRKAGVNNPVFMLDELDKVGADFRGDPTSALLEILDPAQNYTFQDHYVNAPFDLSKVMFIGTANYMAPVPPALRDRMEIIELPGYTPQDKLQIADRYLIPRQLKENGLSASQAKWTDPAVNKIISSYTRESGVRELERQIGAICRGIAALVAAEKARSRTVNEQLVEEMLGPRKYESELAMRTSVPGVVTGLAYTPAGGEIIFVEATSYPGTGKLQLTGQIGDVMKESAEAALSLLKSQAQELGIDSDRFARTDIHIHVPAGAIPKDGPSAGVAMFTALASLFQGKPVRHDLAMTGEVTLRGLVLPIGGVKEKVLAAKRAGIRTVLLPERNRKDLFEVPEGSTEGMELAFATTVQDVLAAALDGNRVKSRKSRSR
jgi:ATP-dependent Lon protease